MRVSDAPPGLPRPVALVAFPDGQRVFARLLARRQEADGEWWYEVEMSLWARRVDSAGRVTGEPAPIRYWVPGAACTPLEGEDYADVPTERAGRRRTGGLLLAHRADTDDPPVLRRGDCASVEGHAVSVTDRQLAERQDAVVRCEVCRPPPG